MKGFLRQRGNAWELRVYLGTDPVTGKQRYTSRSVRTVGELLEAWFEHAAVDFSPKTVKETRRFIDRDLLPAVGHVPLAG